jgi:hypothetical protein
MRRRAHPTIGLLAGSYRLTLRARDAAGNLSAGRSATFLVAAP